MEQLREEDTYEFQRARIFRLAEELTPSRRKMRIEFDDDHKSRGLVFRISDHVTGKNEKSFRWQPIDWHDRPENWLRQYMKELIDKVIWG